MKPKPFTDDEVRAWKERLRKQPGGREGASTTQVQCLSMVKFRDSSNREWYVDYDSFMHYVAEGLIPADAISEVLPNTALKILGGWSSVSLPSSQMPNRSTPPSLAEKALLLTLSKEEREGIIGDLAEEYSDIRSRHGKEFADLWYWRQVIASTAPVMFMLIRRWLVALLEEWFRRHV